MPVIQKYKIGAISRKKQKAWYTTFPTSWGTSAPASKTTSWATGTFAATLAPTSWNTNWNSSSYTSGGGYYTYYDTFLIENSYTAIPTSWETSATTYYTGWADTYVNGVRRSTAIPNVPFPTNYLTFQPGGTMVPTSGGVYWQTSSVTTSSWYTGVPTSMSTSINTTINTLASSFQTAMTTSWTTNFSTIVNTWRETQW